MQLHLLYLSALAGTVYTQALSELIGSNPELSKLNDLINQNQDVLSKLYSNMGLTFLAPSNSAIDAFLAKEPKPSPELLAATLLYHGLNNVFPAADIPEGKSTTITTLLEPGQFAQLGFPQAVRAVRSGDSVAVYSGLNTRSNVTTADIEIDAGICHIIDSVLIVPQSISATLKALGLEKTLEVLEQAEYMTVIEDKRDITFLAPTNEAWAPVEEKVNGMEPAAIAQVLVPHVPAEVMYSSDLTESGSITVSDEVEVDLTVTDGEIKFGSATIVIENVLVSNGVMHVVNGVLSPELGGSLLASTEEEGSEEGLVSNPSATISNAVSSATASAGESESTNESAASSSSVSVGVLTLIATVAAFFSI